MPPKERELENTAADFEQLLTAANSLIAKFNYLEAIKVLEKSLHTLQTYETQWLAQRQATSTFAWLFGATCDYAVKNRAIIGIKLFDCYIALEDHNQALNALRSLSSSYLAQEIDERRTKIKYLALDKVNTGLQLLKGAGYITSEDINNILDTINNRSQWQKVRDEVNLKATLLTFSFQPDNATMQRELQELYNTFTRYRAVLSASDLLLLNKLEELIKNRNSTTVNLPKAKL